MTRSRRTAADFERRRTLLAAASGLHPANPAVATAQRTPAVKVPRLRRFRREELVP